MSIPYGDLTTRQRAERAAIVGAGYLPTNRDDMRSLVMLLCENAYRQALQDAEMITAGESPIAMEWDVPST